jgi:hypothetical protein
LIKKCKIIAYFCIFNKFFLNCLGDSENEDKETSKIKLAWNSEGDSDGSGEGKLFPLFLILCNML